MGDVGRLSTWLIPLLTITLIITGRVDVRAQSSGSTTASVTGVVRDQTGAVISGARVIVRNTATGLERDATTGEDGAYRILLLPPGTYDVSAESPGFATQTVRDVALTVGQTMELDFSLRPGRITEIVEISGDIPLLEPTRTESSTTIDQQKIDNLPINRRNFLDFTLTTPNVTVDRMPAQGAAATSGLSFNGQSARQNNITIDGLDNNDYGSSSVRATFSQEAVQEFQVVNNSYSAEFGRALGGIINIVTRRGTNEFHGSTFFFVRNDALNARNAFAEMIPPFEQYQFGGTLGGPIVKDKHFLFGSFERLSLKDTNVVTINDAIVAAARRLGFSSGTIRNGAIPFGEGLTMVLARGDLTLSEHDMMWIRYTFAGSVNENLEPWGGLFAQSFGGVGRLTDHNLAIANTWVIAPTLINETRFLFGRRRQEVDPMDPAGGPQVRIFAGSDQIVFGRNELLPQPRTENIIEVVDNVSITRGKHVMKLGADIYYAEAPPGTTSIPILFGAQVRFSDLELPGIPLLTALQAFDPTLRTDEQTLFLDFFGQDFGIPDLGSRPIPQAFIQGFGNAEDSISTSYISAYIQDDIRLGLHLTLKAGLRYDVNTLPEPFPSNGGHNFGPRIAFAWDPTARGKWLIHGAYGIFYGTTQLGPMFAVRIVDGTKIRTPVLPFPFSLAAFDQPGHRYPESPTVPEGVPVVNQLSRIFDADPEFTIGYTHQASFGFDVLVTPNMSFSVNYQMTRGLHLFLSRNINPVVNLDCARQGIVPENLPAEFRDPNLMRVLPALCGRVFNTEPEIFRFESSGDSYYHGITFSLNRRFSRHISFLAHYTLSKAIDDFVDWRVENQETGNPLNLRGERSLSLQDARHRFVFSGVWDLDYWKHWLVRGFALSSIITLNSGRPWNLLAGVDLDGNGDNPPGDRPAGLGRNAGVSPGFANVDLRVTRTIKLNERAKVQLFAEAFNLFNRVNITDFGRVFPPGTPLPPKKGGRFIVTPDRFREAAHARQIQFGFRLRF